MKPEFERDKREREEREKFQAPKYLFFMHSVNP